MGLFAVKVYSVLLWGVLCETVVSRVINGVYSVGCTQ